MRIHALSDIHVGYDENARWVRQLSNESYRDDTLILAGDISDTLTVLERTLRELAAKFRQVLYVCGNHDLWVLRDRSYRTSLDKFRDVVDAAEQAGVSTRRFSSDGVRIVPLQSWYDYSFGVPSASLRDSWMDFSACRWPAGYGPTEIAEHFERMNDTSAPAAPGMTITFSHFLPTPDVLPDRRADTSRWLLPVLGTYRLARQIRALRPAIHVYGHSHINRRVTIDGVSYVNNAFAYPHETKIAAKRLVCIHET